MGGGTSWHLLCPEEGRNGGQGSSPSSPLKGCVLCESLLTTLCLSFLTCKTHQRLSTVPHREQTLAKSQLLLLIWRKVELLASTSWQNLVGFGFYPQGDGSHQRALDKGVT